MIGTLNYLELLQAFIPRPITTEEEYDETVKEMNRLIDKDDLTADEQEFLTLLGTLVMAYENEYYPDKDFELHGVELVKGLLELQDLKQQDLVPIFKTKSIVSAVLNGKRPLTVDHIDGLARFFNLPHELFFARR